MCRNHRLSQPSQKVCTDPVPTPSQISCEVVLVCHAFGTLLSRFRLRSRHDNAIKIHFPVAQVEELAEEFRGQLVIVFATANSRDTRDTSEGGR